MVVVEYAWVDDLYSRASPCQLGISRMDHLPGLSLLCDTIKANGAAAAIQISHAGRQRFILEQPKAASDVPWPEITAQGCPIPEPMTIDEIQEVVKAFGAAAKRAQMAGFDMVEIHACHGYLISNFLSPYSNKRTDWYGGSFENRIRILLDIIREIKAQVGARLSHLLPTERHRLRAGRLRHRRDRRALQAPGSSGSGGDPHVGRHPSHHHPRSEPHGHVAGAQRVGGRGGQEGDLPSRHRLAAPSPLRRSPRASSKKVRATSSGWGGHSGPTRSGRSRPEKAAPRTSAPVSAATTGAWRAATTSPTRCAARPTSRSVGKRSSPSRRPSTPGGWLW